MLKAIGMVLVLILMGFGAKALLTSKWQNENRAEWTERRTLKEIARQARAAGRQQVTVRGPFIDYAGVDMDLKTAVQAYSAFVVEPIQDKSYVADDDLILTWWRFRILDAISEKPAVFCATCPSAPEVPEDFRAITSDELILPVIGGTVGIDGVQVTLTNNSLPPFEKKRQYFLFVSVTPNHVASLAAGPSGIFLINDEQLIPINQYESPLKVEIHSRFERKLSKLKTHIRP